MTTNRLLSLPRAVHRVASAIGGALLAGLALAATPAQGAEQALRLPEFDFSACPTAAELPAGADPGTWRCEVMVATGHLRLGAVDEPLTKPLTITFAEGRVGGEFRQVFGRMTAAPIRLGRTPLTVTPLYGGYSDFLSNDSRRGELDLTFTLGAIRPLPSPPPGCSVGSVKTPIHLILRDTDPARVISTDPLVVTFGAEDKDFTAPATTHCGRLGRIFDRALALPSPKGSNAIDLDATVAIRPYR
ncbi:hypothetical protein ACIQNU_21280 [Streptomyces sp. NPDC091292]|uniref:hypothetical protein n=1 Tax=Streptomyces sp. NPDC091292 TaxID=3365991 RepID=UPI003811F9A1